MDLQIIETLDGDGNIVPGLVINDKWIKPLNELSMTFNEYITDVNTGIVNALWRRDKDMEGNELGYFSLQKLDKFMRRKLFKFWETYGDNK
jgi:hypothetical protein